MKLECIGGDWGNTATSYKKLLLTSKQTILDCSEANEGFYVKCGFKRAGLEMAHYYGR